MFARKLFCMTPVLKAYCAGKPSIEYCRATQDWVSQQGVNLNFMSSKGLTMAGKQQFCKLVLGKINCGKLWDKYLALRNLAVSGS